jgi:enoyl-CoA hydratase
MSEQTLAIVEQRGSALLVELRRPQRLNALTFAMFDELRVLCESLEHDDAVRVLVLTGSGRGFCAGLDLDEAARLADMTAPQMLAGQESWARGITALCRLNKPVIAAVNGPAAGAGFALALAADIRIASTAARFNAAFVRIGLSGGDCGTTWLLPRIVGLGRASELLYTGRLIDASEAARMGLVNEVVEPDALVERAFAVAQEIAANSPFGLRLTKQVLQANVDAPSLEAALELENRNQVLATRTRDMPEALDAFRERRAPVFENR